MITEEGSANLDRALYMAVGMGVAFWPHHGTWRSLALVVAALVVLPVVFTCADWTHDRVSPYLTWTPWRKPT